MTIMRATNIVLIMDRIKTATPESPIAVFGVDEGSFNVVFGDTLKTQEMIKEPMYLFVGVYDGKMDMWKVRSELEASLQRH